MRAPRGDEGVSKFVEVPGALLTKEDYPTIIAEELYQFLQEIFESNIWYQKGCESWFHLWIQIEEFDTLFVHL